MGHIPASSWRIAAKSETVSVFDIDAWREVWDRKPKIKSFARAKGDECDVKTSFNGRIGRDSAGVLRAK